MPEVNLIAEILKRLQKAAVKERFLVHQILRLKLNSKKSKLVNLKMFSPSANSASFAAAPASRSAHQTARQQKPGQEPAFR